jgi:hypothetical protein
VRGTLADHLQHGIEHARNRPESSLLPVGEATQSIEMAEEFVGSVDQVNDHVDWLHQRNHLENSRIAR